MRWHLWIALSLLGRLELALASYSVYFALRATGGVLRKAGAICAEPRISVLIVAKNEEHNLADCLRAASWADERMVVVDGPVRTQRTRLPSRWRTW